MKKSVLCLSAMASVLSFSQVNADSLNNYTLEQVVMLSRHGIRAPLIGYGSSLVESTPYVWPRWNTQGGHLTAKGAKLEFLFARYLDQWLKQTGVLPMKGCPQNQVLIYTNSLPRTIETGKSFVSGAFPNCNIKVNYLEKIGTMDNTFNPIIRTRVDQEFIQKATHSIDNMFGKEKFSGLNESIKNNYKILEKVLDYKDSVSCKEKKFCNLIQQKNTLTFEQNKEAKTSGPLRLGTGAADSFILQYYEGFPLNEVAWGKIKTPAEWKAIADIKNIYTDVLFSSPVLAKEAATPLVKFIQNSFIDHGYQHSLQKQAKNAKFTILVGHDSNIASVLSLLKVKPYTLPGQYEKTPISGKIVFERWHNKITNKDFIKIEYIYQTADQLRNGTVLNNSNPPKRVVLKMKNCPVNKDGLCPLTDFDKAITRVLAN